MADLLPVGTLPNIMLWASICLKMVVINMHSVDLLWLDEDPLEWMKMCFALVPNHNVLHNIRLNLSIKDASESTLYKLFKAWLELHDLLDEERFRALKDVHVKIYLGWCAMQEYDQLDLFDFPEVVQGFSKRGQYELQVMNFKKSKKLTYYTV